MAFSYSFHLSNKGNSVSNKNKVAQVSRHNLRKYKSEDYDQNQIVMIKGTENLYEDVEKIYHDEFDAALEKYNEGKRADRKIKDYFQHISDSRSDVAAEIIIQVGDMEFWKDVPKDKQKAMNYIFKDQVRSLEQLCPEFKIASAVVHYDEKSPHLHIVGVPVAEGYTKGMSKQVAKTKIFTKESLAMLQEQMRKRAERGIEMNQAIFGDAELKQKEKGRNKDIPKYALEQFYEVKEQVKEKETELVEVEEEVIEARNEVNQLRNDSKGIDEQIKEKKAEYDAIKSDIEQSKERFLSYNTKLMNQKNQIAMNDNTINNQNALISSQEAQIDSFKRISDKFMDESSAEHYGLEYEFVYEYKGKTESGKPIPVLKKAVSFFEDKIESMKEKISGLMEMIKNLTHRKEKLEAECNKMESELNDIGILVSEKVKYDRKDKMIQSFNQIADILSDKEIKAFENGDLEEMNRCLSSMASNFRDNRPQIFRKYQILIRHTEEYLKVKNEPVSIQELKEQVERQRRITRNTGRSR